MDERISSDKFPNENHQQMRIQMIMITEHQREVGTRIHTVKLLRKNLAALKVMKQLTRNLLRYPPAGRNTMT